MKDSSNLLPDELRELLRLERAAETVSPVLQARLAERLTTSLGVSLPHDPQALQSGGPSALGRNAGSSAMHWLTSKPIIAALVFAAGASVGSMATLGVQSLRSPPVVSSPPPETTPKPTAAGANAQPALPPPDAQSTAASRDDVPPAPTAAPPSAARERAALPRARATGSAAVTDLRGEQLLVDQARNALARDRAADALAALETHLRHFPAGQLAEERASLYVVALARAGRRPEAERAARQFRTRYPRSLFIGIVEQAFSTTP